MSTFLVVAHQTADSSELRQVLLAKSQEDPRAIFTMLVPATAPEELLDAEGTDGVGIARRALALAVDSLEEQGIKFARCTVGNSDPLTAIGEEFERSRRTYDGVILCTLPFGVSRWLEQDLIDKIGTLFEVPVTHVVAATASIRERQSVSTHVRVVTFSVRLGTPGLAIARKVAERLGFRYYDWEITSEAAKRAGVPPDVIAASEQAKPLLARVMDHLLVTGVYADDEVIGRLSSATMSSAISTLSSREYRSFVERVVLELAQYGDAVVVGHGSQVVLGYEPGVMKVLITGSAQGRAKLLAEAEERSLEEAVKLISASDEERKSFFKQTYSVDLLNPDLYDIALNTDRLSIDTAAEAIVRMARSRPPSIDAGKEQLYADLRSSVQVHGRGPQGHQEKRPASAGNS